MKIFRIKTMNSISELGTNYLSENGCEVGRDVENPHALLIRSSDIHDMHFGSELLCIGRAGSGTNNIPVGKCTDLGIAVFNAPGANAEAVKELTLCSLVMSSRDVLGSIDWTRSISDCGEKIPEMVEKGKSSFIGPELYGKTLGVIGLGACGALIANAARDLGMVVYGYDPFISIHSAWRLERDVRYSESLSQILKTSDYISLNVPYTRKTHHMIDREAIKQMKNGVRIINESRAEVVDDDAMIEALDCGKVFKYITDFPNEKILSAPNVIAMPHIGASTPESEEKCALMAARSVYEYLKNGNIKNSVNFPDAFLDREGECRLCIFHKNVPNMINSFLDYISERNINVENLINKASGNEAYTIIDLGCRIDDEVIKNIALDENVIRIRSL